MLASANLRQLDKFVDSFLLSAIAERLPLDVLQCLDDIRFSGWRPMAAQFGIVGNVWFVPKSGQPVTMYVRIDEAVIGQSPAAIMKVVEYEMQAIAEQAEPMLRGYLTRPPARSVRAILKQASSVSAPPVDRNFTGPRARQIDLEVE